MGGHAPLAQNAPSLQFEATVCKVKGREKFGVWSRAFLQRAFFTCTSIAMHCSAHWTRSDGPFQGRGQGAGQLHKTGHEPAVITSQPQKLSHLLSGLGQDVTAAVLSICGRTCPPPKWCPRYYISFCPTTRFFGSPACLGDSRAMATQYTCSTHFIPLAVVSIAIFLHHKNYGAIPCTV